MALFGAKGRDKVFVVPRLDVVVFFLPTVDIAFNSVAVVADDEAYVFSQS